ncbi:MAG: F0F1 ATP synthase subunit epsilon [Oscillatoriales cyanobacterium RM2_1_1]|nr:F0F1 ATP synthase subunit epsilon [Oscillatoriales cyanobacterium SM2_3_0]NJO44935.1 F0F1 ATP synthase subunit epsilon [Oscillatoriales cyanobacterium RM2_1_1]
MVLTVRVISPSKTVWDGQADEIILPSTTGQVGILTGHVPMMTALDTGVMRVRVQNEWIPIVLLSGFAEIEEDEVTILVNGAEPGNDIDMETARTAYTNALTALTQAEMGTEQEKIKAKNALKRARARFQAAGGMV